MHGKQTATELGRKYHKSRQWILKQLNDINVDDQDIINIKPQSIIVVADTTFFTRSYGITVFREPNLKKNLIWQETLLEPIRGILKGIKLSQKRIDEIVEALKITEQSKNKFQQQQFKELRNEHDRISNRISVMYVDRLDGRITTDEYDKNVKEFKEKQDDLLFQMRKYNNADKTFYITANHILSLAQRASEIFESSQVEEKRQLLNFLFRNLQLDGKKLQYKLKTPFDTVLLVQNNSNWGG